MLCVLTTVRKSVLCLIKKRIRLKLVTDGRLVAVNFAHRVTFTPNALKHVVYVGSKVFCITLMGTDNGVIQNPFVFIFKIL